MIAERVVVATSAFHGVRGIHHSLTELPTSHAVSR
jgi:hypothetical protein